MGTLTSQEYATEDGREYVAYLDRVLQECVRLRAEGRLPDSDGVDGFLGDAQVVLHQVRRDVASASARGAGLTTTEVRLSSEEHQRIVMMGESLRTLLEILEMRKALVLDRTPAVARVAQAVLEGSFAH